MLRQHSSQSLPVTPYVGDNPLRMRTHHTPSYGRQTRGRTRSVYQHPVPSPDIAKKGPELKGVVSQDPYSGVTSRGSWQRNRTPVFWIQNVGGVIFMLRVTPLDNGSVYAESSD